MRTRIHSAAILLSLFLCLASLISWALSYSNAYDAGWACSQWTAASWYRSNYLVGVDAGQFWLKFGHSTLPMATPDFPAWKTYTPDARQRFVRFHNDRPDMAGWISLTEPHPARLDFLKNSIAGFECFRPVGLDVGRFIAIPAWLLILLFAIPPAQWLRKRTRKIRPFPIELTPFPA